MRLSSVAICPYLQGGEEGARCSVAEELIRTLEGATVKLCMHRHHESCGYYFIALQRALPPKYFADWNRPDVSSI